MTDAMIALLLSLVMSSSLSAQQTDSDEFVLFQDDFQVPYLYNWDVSGPYWDYYSDEYLREYFHVSGTCGNDRLADRSPCYIAVAHATDTLASPDDIYIPVFTDSIYVECTMSYYAYCAAIGILLNPWTHAELYLLTEGNEPVLVWEFYADAKFTSSREATSWSWDETIIAPLSEEMWNCGESIAFQMIGTCHAEGVSDAAVILDWKLDDFSVLGISSSNFELDTWGSIKSTL